MRDSEERTGGVTLSVPSARKDANQNVVKILKAAKEVFKEKGSDARLEEIAEKAGVGVGTVYRRFVSKDRLVWAVGMEIVAEIRKQQLFDAQLSLPADQKIRLILEEFLLLHHQYGKLQEMLLQLAEESQFGEEIRSALTDVLNMVIQEGQEQRIFRPGSPAVFEAYILHLVHPKLITKLRAEMPVSAIPRTIADLILKGLS